MKRRQWLLTTVAATAPTWVVAHANHGVQPAQRGKSGMPPGGQPAPPTGLVLPPQALPVMQVQTVDRGWRKLDELLTGRVTAVQLMFTGCATSCPVQGALFAAVAAAGLPPQAQLLSISVDALSDEPASLARWLGRFGDRTPAWSAAVPRVDDVSRLASSLTGTARTAGTHTGQVFLFDRNARLRFRTADLPAAGEVRSLLHQLAAV